MILRVLPLLQLTKEEFGAEWAEQWLVLDDSFRLHVEDVWRLYKPIFGAIVFMIDNKFAFTPASSYVE